jgi:hypothetical protein
MAVPANSLAEGSMPHEVKRASQTDANQSPFCLQAVCQHSRLTRPPIFRPTRQAIASDHIFARHIHLRSA